MAADGPYYLRSKRRKLSATTENCCCVVFSEDLHRRRKNPLLHLPTEVLLLILKNLSFHDLAKRMRCVNKRFKILVEDLLNQGFKRLGKQLEVIKSDAVYYLDVSTDPKEVRYRCKVLNVVETIIFYYELIMATIWRYVYAQRSKLCMYGGEILDDYAVFVRQYLLTPRNLCISNKTKHYKAVPRIVYDIRKHAKLFCRQFEQLSELQVNSISNSGAKLLDILDTANYAMRTRYEEKFKGKTYTCKLHYYFSYSWFAAIESSESGMQTMGWREHQKYMYMRLRRLVIAHTEIQLNQAQYIREQELLRNTAFFIPKPRSFMYTGYGEEENNFFLYGVMNQQCYQRRYGRPEGREDQGDADAHIEPESRSSHSSLATEYQLGVHIWVTLKCPLRLAPRKALQNYTKQNEDIPKAKGNFELHMNIVSPGNSQIRVSEKFCYVVKGRRK